MPKTFVLKFGGKTIADFDKLEEASNRIIEAYNKQNNVVVVVSAMGNETEELIELAAQIDACGFYKEMDQLLATGEMKASALMTMLLKKKGLDAVSLHFANAGIKTNSEYFNADILEINVEKIKTLLSKNKIVVVAGYQGINDTNDVTTLGRGGSDITAVKLASVLNAECILFKDVGAIYTADPKQEKSDKIDKIRVSELEKILGDNPKVIHKTSLDIAKKERVKIMVANPENFEIGTIIE